MFCPEREEQLRAGAHEACCCLLAVLRLFAGRTCNDKPATHLPPRLHVIRHSQRFSYKERSGQYGRAENGDSVSSACEEAVVSNDAAQGGSRAVQVKAYAAGGRLGEKVYAFQRKVLMALAAIIVGMAVDVPEVGGQEAGQRSLLPGAGSDILMELKMLPNGGCGLQLAEVGTRQQAAKQEIQGQYFSYRFHQDFTTPLGGLSL